MKIHRRIFLTILAAVGAAPILAHCGKRCHGNGKKHCCWIEGEVCEYLEENTVPGRRWACGLYREMGSWDAVHKSKEHKDLRNKTWKGTKAYKLLCGDWPQKMQGWDCEQTSGACCFSHHPDCQPQ